MTRICLLASSQEEAYRFARSQYLEKEQWFYASSPRDLIFQSNFHVLVVNGSNFPSTIFERTYQIAQERGKIGRK